MSDNTHIFLIAAVSDVLDAPVQEVDFIAHNAAYCANRDRLEAMSYWQRLAESIADLLRGTRPEDSFPPPIVTSVPLRTRLEQHHATASDRWQITDALLGDLVQLDPAVFVAQHTLRRAALDPDDVSLMQLPPALQGRWADALAVLDTIPGMGPRVAEIMLAEIGPDMARFPDAAHLARWVRVCPGNHERAGKRSSGKTGTGNPWLRSAVIQAAHAAVNARDSWLGRVYRRLVPRLGVKKAMVAIAHRLIIAIYHRLRKQEPYREPTTVPDDAAQKLRRLKRVQQQVEALGGTVSLPPVAPLAA